MTSKDFRSIISEVNLRAKAHPIGTLREIRKDLKRLKLSGNCLSMLFGLGHRKPTH
jgi:hypothetical protein